MLLRDSCESENLRRWDSNPLVAFLEYFLVNLQVAGKDYNANVVDGIGGP